MTVIAPAGALPFLSLTDQNFLRLPRTCYSSPIARRNSMLCCMCRQAYPAALDNPHKLVKLMTLRTSQLSNALLVSASGL